MMPFLNNITTIFVQIITFDLKMPKIGIEDRVFSWVMHLSDLKNITSHVSICPKYPRVCSFLFDIIALRSILQWKL